MTTAWRRPHEEDRTTWILGLAIALSLLFHTVGIPGFMVLVNTLGWLTPVQAALLPQEVDIEMITQEEEEEEPEEILDEPEEVEPEIIEPDPPPRRRDDPAPEEPAQQTEPEQEQPEEPQPLDFTGITLTGEGGDFAVNAGDGSDREGPIGPAPMRATSPTGMGRGGGGGEPGGMGPPLVASSDLSRRPEAPQGAHAQLLACMLENYPEQARRQGIEAVVNATLRVNPSGAIASVHIRSESVTGQGFGRVCSRCLRQLPNWSSPLDRRGNPVATRERAYCRFSVRY